MHLNKFVYFLLFSFSQFVYSKEVLFIDLNSATDEVAAARKAAIENGDTLVVIPPKGALYSHEEFLKLIKEKSFKSLIISGHSDGSNYEGNDGKNKVKIEDILQALDQGKTEEIESLYLMGCYTSNKSKIAFWKHALPQLKFLAGFDIDGPLKTQPAAHKFLYDLIKNEKRIIGTPTYQELAQLLSGIDVLKIVNASLYISCQEEDYNYVSQLPSQKRLTKLSVSECAEQVGLFRKNFLEEVRLYWEAKKEPTHLNPKDGILRKAYSTARQAEHCRDLDSREFMNEIDPDKLFFLLFNKAFNENFSRYYKSLIEEALFDAELAHANPEEYVEKRIKDTKERDQKIDLLLGNPHFHKMVDAELAKLKNKQENLEKKFPTIINCYKFNRECNFPNSILKQYVALHSTLKYNSKEYHEWLGLLKNSDQASIPLHDLTKMDRTKIDIIKKMSTSPQDVTRQDIVTLVEAFKTQGHLTPALEELRNKLNKAYELSEMFPFSWYDYTGGEIESPTSENAQFENPALSLINVTILQDNSFSLK